MNPNDHSDTPARPYWQQERSPSTLLSKGVGGTTTSKGEMEMGGKAKGIWSANAFALAALFFALGGSALAVNAASKPSYVVKCGPGSIEASAIVVGDVNGLANTPDSYTSDKAIFQKTYTCRGGPVQIKRDGVGVFDVRFPGNPATTAVVSGLAETPSSVTPRQPDGSFRVSVFVTGTDAGVLLRRDLPFSIVAFS